MGNKQKLCVWIMVICLMLTILWAVFSHVRLIQEKRRYNILAAEYAVIEEKLADREDQLCSFPMTVDETEAFNANVATIKASTKVQDTFSLDLARLFVEFYRLGKIPEPYITSFCIADDFYIVKVGETSYYAYGNLYVEAVVKITENQEYILFAALQD